MVRIVGALSLILLGLLVVVLLGSSFLISSDLLKQDLVEKYRSDASFFYRLPSGAQAHIRNEGKRSGPPLLLIHGAHDSLHSWEAWVNELGDTYRLISVDLPGHGLTGATAEGDYTIDAMARFAKEIVDLFALDEVTLVGNAMGGAVALKFALDYPDQTASLVLIAASGMTHGPDRKTVGGFAIVSSAFGRSLMRYVTPKFLIRQTLRAMVVNPDAVITGQMVTRYWELLRMTGSRDAAIKRFASYETRGSLEPSLPAIKAPALILWGVQDPLAPVAQGIGMARILSGSRIKVYGEAGHLVQIEIPEKSAADTRGFLQDTLR